MCALIDVTRDQVESVIPLLTQLNPRLSAGDWQTLLNHPWTQNSERIGRALVRGDRPVGFIGLLESKRLVNAEPHTFLNITSWIVEERYRSQAATLALDLRRLPNHTITNLTPSVEVGAILQALEFEVLETSWRVMPLVAIGNLGRAPTVLTDPLAIHPRLPPAEQALSADHQLPRCRHLWLEVAGGSVYMIYRLAQRRGLLAVEPLYLSDASRLARSWRTIARHLRRRERATVWVCETRLLEGERWGVAWDHQLKVPRYYRSNQLRAAEIDNLYSELCLLPGP